MKTLSILLILFNISTIAQTPKKPDDLETAKFKLCEYLLSCQTMFNTIMLENDPKMKKYLNTKNLEYFNKANQQFTKLQDSQSQVLNEDLRKNIQGLIDLYGKIIGDISLLNDPVYSVAFAFADNIYKTKVLPELWTKQ